MGRIIIPDELKSASQSIQSANSQYSQALEDILPTITHFESQENLQGQSWMGIKAQLSDYRSIIQGAVAALDSMNTDCESLSSLCGEETLIEDDILQRINQLQSLIGTYQECIDNLQSTLYNNVAMDVLLGSHVRGMIGVYQTCISSTFVLLEAFYKKLQRLNEIDAATASLFGDIATDLLYIKLGLNCVNAAWDGSGFSLERNSAWKQKLDERWWEVYNRRILEQYFDLDKNGNIIGVKPEMAGKVYEILTRLFHFLSEEDAGAFATELSDDERYLLAYLAITYGPKIFDFYYTAAENALEVGDREGFSLQDLIDDLSSKFDGDAIPLISDLLSFTFKDGKFTSLDKPTSLQARGGFSDFYDYAVGFLGMDIDTTITVFTYGDKEYRIQVWDGLYAGGLSIGGEIGLYARPLSDAQANPYIEKDLADYAARVKTLSPSEINNLFINHRSLANEEDQIPMLMSVYDTDGNNILRNDTQGYANEGTHYWNYAAVENINLEYVKEDVHVVGELIIEDRGLLESMQNALQKDGIDAKILTDGQTLEITWKQ